MTSLSVVALALAMVGAPVALAGFRLAGAEAAAGAERVELLRGALALDPSDWEARVALARELGPGSPQDARRALMEEAPEPLLDARVLHMAAMADWSEGLKDRADAQMRLAAETAPGYPDIVHAAGTYFMRRWIEERGGNSPLLDEAVIWLRRTLEVDGRRLRTILEMMALAPASARRMAEVVPEDAAARLWLADRLTEKGRLPEAALLLERTVSSADGRSLFRLHEKLAELRDTMGDVNGALDARVRAVASRPAIERPAAAARIVEKLTSERKWADAMMFAQALGRRMPEGGAAIFASAVLDAASGDHRRAVEGFRRFARTSRLPDAYYRLALSARRLGYLGEAESALNTAVRERPHENRYLLVRAEIREQAGAWNSAAEDIRQALDRSPANVALRRRLADVYSRAGREIMAARVWEEGLAVRPDDPEILTALAASYARAGFFDKAGQFAGKALEIDPESRAAARILESLP